MYKYQAYKKGIHDEQRVVEDGWIIRNEERLEQYLNAVKKDRPNLFSALQDHEILKMMKVEKNTYPTIAGLMVFSEYPQGAFPNFCVTAVAVPGPNRRITGSIPEMLEETIGFIEKNSRRRTIIDQNGRRADEPEYPIRAVRELVLNALIHRDYSMYTENAPIRVEMFSDRLEITNSGGIYGRMPVEKLGYDSPETRNSVLTNILEKSGIPVIRNEMRKRGLPAPEFIDTHREFKAILYSKLPSISVAEKKENRPEEWKQIIEFCKEPRSRKEIAEYTGKTQNYIMQQWIKPMIEQKLLKMTNPDKPKSRYQKFVKTGE